MPSTMIHLMLADKLSNSSPIEFFIGNIAPDAIITRENITYKYKDKLHFRNFDNRLEEIGKLFTITNTITPYLEGYIIHLFFDTYWDNDCMIKFKHEHNIDKWFVEYRKELSIASTWLYQNDITLNKRWREMTSCCNPNICSIQGISYSDIKNYYELNSNWFRNTLNKESSAFPNAFLENYTDIIARKYTEWKINN